MIESRGRVIFRRVNIRMHSVRGTARIALINKAPVDSIKNWFRRFRFWPAARCVHPSVPADRCGFLRGIRSRGIRVRSRDTVKKTSSELIAYSVSRNWLEHPEWIQRFFRGMFANEGLQLERSSMGLYLFINGWSILGSFGYSWWAVFDLLGLIGTESAGRIEITDVFVKRWWMFLREIVKEIDLKICKLNCKLKFQ